MSEKSKLINRLVNEKEYRAAYIRAKLDVLIPSQLRALRLGQEKTQKILAVEAEMKQSRISAMETPGKVNFNLETLVSLAATFKVGLVVKFVPFSALLRWENEFSQDSFDVIQIDNDSAFKTSEATTITSQFTTSSYNNFIGRQIAIKNISVGLMAQPETPRPSKVLLYEQTGKGEGGMQSVMVA